MEGYPRNHHFVSTESGRYSAWTLLKASQCTATPPLKKIGKERRSFPIFLRGGAAVHGLLKAKKEMFAPRTGDI